MVVLMEVLLMAMLMITAMQVGPGDGYVLTVGGFNNALSTLGDFILLHGGSANGGRITIVVTVLKDTRGVGGIIVAWLPTQLAEAVQPKQMVLNMWCTGMGGKEVKVEIVLKRLSFCLSRNKLN